MSYQTELDTAIKAVLAAGEMLRTEFYHSAGPRGQGDHADIDTEMEVEIRKILMDLHADWGYYGEETGRVEGHDSGAHLWLVDPNDGTSAFLKGYRGSAVSIALLREGKPVLGVVYAPMAPDVRGDLITWAEGCGPLSRNGRIVKLEPSSSELTSYDIVLVSYVADTRSISNALFFHPARFVAVPSIAYRLALVAVGEAAAAVSFHNPVGYDYGAGHALLIAGGACLKNEKGEEIEYSPSGESSCQVCFGGSPAVVNELVKRDWQAVISGIPSQRLEYNLVEPVKMAHIKDMDMLNRGRGCLMGQCVGDALGSLVEFKSPESIARLYPQGVRTLHDGGTFNTIAGQPTDDTEMALMLARSILTKGNGYSMKEAARAYLYWYASGPFDIGRTTSRALAELKNSMEEGALRAPEDPGVNSSQANGSLMRVSPIGIWGHAMSFTEVAGFARQDNSLTHPHIVCRDAVSVFVGAISRAISTGEGPEDVYGSTIDYAEKAVCSGVLDILRKARESPPQDYQSQMGWVLVALQNAFYQMLHAESVEVGIVDTVMRGGDTDTNAAIAGALLGAVHGYSAIPKQWRQMVLSCRPIYGVKGVCRPRPHSFWPVDILELAERLMVVGRTNARAWT